MVKKILLGCSLVCALYFTSTASWSLLSWYRLDDRAWANVTSWRVIEIDPSQFAIEAEFSFEHAGKTYNGVTKYAKPYSFNRPSAEKDIEHKKQERPIVFYNSKKPQSCSLEHAFPLKKCFYAALTLGILAYFGLLEGILLQKRMKKAGINGLKS